MIDVSRQDMAGGKSRRAGLAALLLWLSGVVLGQGAISGFPVAEGEVSVAPAWSVERYSEYFGPDGTVEDRDVRTLSYSLFVEAGMNEQTALVATLPYLRTNDDPGSLQDASLWIKYRNLDQRTPAGAHRVFTAVGLSFPVGNYATSGPTAIGQRASVFQGRLVYQYQFDSGFFLHAQSGIDFQFAPESRANWPLLLRSGYGTRYYYFEGWLEFVTTLEPGPAVRSATAGTGSSWRRVGGTLYVPLLPWAGLVGGGAYVLGGEYIGRSTRYNLGMVVKLVPK
ncbi:transporter [Lewinella sp. IMCC34183]|uniref:transporter n=1 Tax=Lewinella sp. IMCC34183 TaxID=2248762 RepID=UPI000E270DDD|nr:transporter [Lewinella sp. IMCC34183]